VVAERQSFILTQHVERSDNKILYSFSLFSLSCGRLMNLWSVRPQERKERKRKDLISFSLSPTSGLMFLSFACRMTENRFAEEKMSFALL
jgi:hypothetical protein